MNIIFSGNLEAGTYVVTLRYYRRLHFKNDPYAKRLLELVRSFQVTR